MMACKSSMSISMDPVTVNLQHPYLIFFYFAFLVDQDGDVYLCD